MIFDAPENMDNSMSDEDKRIIATHEAGHIVVAEVLDPGIVNVSSISRHSGSKYGVTCYSRSQSRDFSYKMQEEEVIRLLGGKAAIEVIYGVPDVGSELDFETAYEAVQDYVTKLHIYGFDTHTDYDYSEYWKATQNFRVTYEMERFYRAAKKILTENRKFIDDIVEALLEKQTITFKDIEEIRVRNEPLVCDM